MEPLKWKAQTTLFSLSALGILLQWHIANIVYSSALLIVINTMSKTNLGEAGNMQALASACKRTKNKQNWPRPSGSGPKAW